jgi:Flp pilus assembly protein TadD
MQALPQATYAARFRLLGTVCAAACALGGLVGESAAQQRVRPGETVSQPVVQQLPNADNLRLNAALSRLGRNPRDLDALIDAGGAALATGDVDAATGFFKRADQVSPKDPRVKAGLGGALVRSGDPLQALPLFDEAERLGARLPSLAADRGLAYDLIGDNATAQRLYRLALQAGPNEDATRRLALSLAISGDKRGTEAALLPLLREQDKASWRARTFAMAIMGQSDEAIRTARTILPEQLADSIAPYLRYMPQLTKAQQAAAANLGNFPRASEIGRDDPRLAQYRARAVRPPSLASADSALTPRGEPLGRSQTGRTAVPAVQQEKPVRAAARTASPARTVPPEPQPAREVAAPASVPTAVARPAPPLVSMSAPVVASTQSSSVPPLAAIAAGKAVPDVSFAPALPSAASAPAARPAVAATKPPAPAIPPPKPAAARPGFDLARLPQSQAVPLPPPAPVQAAPAPQPAAPAPPVFAATPAPSVTAPAPTSAPVTQRISLAEAFSDLGKPTLGASAVAPGAVDVRAIAAARPKPAPVKIAPAKPAPPSHPSRIWVQLGVGRDKAALAIDWKKFVRQASAPFKGRKPYVSDMGQTNRMLVGPFDSTAQANKFVADLKSAGVTGSYIWTSPAGQVVDTLPIR